MSESPRYAPRQFPNSDPGRLGKPAPRSRRSQNAGDVSPLRPSTTLPKVQRESAMPPEPFSPSDGKLDHVPPNRRRQTPGERSSGYLLPWSRLPLPPARRPRDWFGTVQCWRGRRCIGGPPTCSGGEGNVTTKFRRLSLREAGNRKQVRRSPWRLRQRWSFPGSGRVPSNSRRIPSPRGRWHRAPSSA